MNDLLETIRKNFEQLEVSSATSNDTFESFGKCRNLTRKISHKAKDYYGLTEEETTPSPSNDCRDQNRTSSFFSKNNSTQPDLIPRISIELISSNDFLTANHISRESSFVSKCVGVDIMPMIGHANSDTLKCREYEKSKHVNEDLASFEKYFPMNQKFLDLETNETNEQNALISNVKNETLRLDVYENLSSHADEMKPKPYGLKYTEYIGENYSLPEKNLVSYDSGIDSGEVETLYEVFTNRSAYSMSFGDIDVVKRQELEDFSASRLSKPKYISCGDIGMTSSGNSSASQNKRRLGAKVGMLVAIFEEHPPSESANASIY